MESKRQSKYSRLIQRELGNIFQRDIKSMFGKAMITVTKVNMSPDLGVAKVYLSLLLADNNQEMLERINLRKKEVRKMLGGKIGNQVKKIPELIFYHDNSAEYSQKIDAILSGLDIPPPEEEKD